MRNIFFIILVSNLVILSCADNTEIATEKDYSVYVSPQKPLLFIDDHVSEGFLVPLDDGRMLLVFRFDPGIEGHHIGLDGYIASIYYDPGKDEWGEVNTVYNSHRYDDRNIHGGITEEGRIVIFFRRYDGHNTEGRYFIYSDDNGQTWSDLQVFEPLSDPEALEMRGNMSTGRMFYNPDMEKYNMLGFLYSWDQNRIYTSRRRYIAYSDDGSSWDEYNFVVDDSDYRLNEIAGAWCGNNRIIVLQRDDNRQYGHPLVQVESYDNGLTWTKPTPTNIPPENHWGAGPQMIYDQKRDLIIAMTSDRYSRPDEQNSLYIYTARPDAVFGNPKGWTLQHELLRPLSSLDAAGNRPLNLNLYGYPTIAPINECEYLVVFTERSRMHGSEQADLYYFRMIIK